MTANAPVTSLNQGNIYCTEGASHIIKQIFCKHDTSLSFFSNDIILMNLIIQYDIPYEQFNQREQCSMLVHHLLHGMCSKHRGTACKLLCKAKTEITAFGVMILSLVLNEFTSANISLGTFEEICYTLGFRMPACQMLPIHEELLKFYNDRLVNLNGSFVSTNTARCLNEQETMIKSSLLILAGSHSLHCVGLLEDLRTCLFTHICSGQCKSFLNANIESEACHNVIDQVPPVQNEDFALALLASIVHHLSGRALHRVATMQWITFSSSESISRLRHLVKKHLVSTAKGKHILE